MHDTHPEARLRQRAALSRLTGAERVLLAAEMAEQAKAIAIAGIRARHPNLNPGELHRAWLCLLHGRTAAENIDAHRPFA